VDLGPEWKREVEQARAELAAMTAEECIRCADLLRSVKPMLSSDSSRALAEREACGFEARAAAKTAAQAS
jgi:hypothetical protein